MTSLLWGDPGDAVIVAVAAALAGIDAAFVVVDGSDIVSIEIGGSLTTRDGLQLTLAEVTGVLVRPSALADPSGYAMLAGWTEITSARVLNRVSAGASNRSKPYQLRLLKEAGFNVPDTLVTTDPRDVRAFCSEYGQVIYKSTSGVRSIVSLLTESDASRIDNVSACPTQFQQYVGGVDHRVHVVGEELFAARIQSGAVDYRYATVADGPTQMDSVALPPEVAGTCLALTRSLGLGLAGIDLRLDPEGRWWCFEVNTSPGFIWFEQQTGHPIAAAVALILVGR